MPAGLSRPLGEELLTPTRIYARDCLALAAGAQVHAFAHVTGGGLAANLARVLPAHADAILDRGTWTPAPVFGFLAREGRRAGGGHGAGLQPGRRDGGHRRRAGRRQALAVLADRGMPAWAAGRVTAGTGTARLTGSTARR